jgi:hypothetical protein
MDANEVRANDRFLSTEGNEGKEGRGAIFALGAITLDNWIGSPKGVQPAALSAVALNRRDSFVVPVDDPSASCGFCVFFAANGPVGAG